MIDQLGSVHARVTAEGRKTAERFAWAILPELADAGARVVGWFDATNEQRQTAKPAFHITESLYAKHQQGRFELSTSGRSGGPR